MAKPVAQHSAHGRKPWHALSVRLAIAIIVLGAAFWSYAQVSDSSSAGALGEYAPGMLGMAVSFLGGFAIGWSMRRFLKWTLLLVAVIGVGILVLRKTGMVDLPWDQIEGHVAEGSSWVQSQAGNAKKLLTRYLPSGVAAVVGVFFGLRR